MKKTNLCGIVLMMLLNLMPVWAEEQIGSLQQQHYYPVRERLQTYSLNGTWQFKLIRGLNIPSEYDGWEKTSFNSQKWDKIVVPGNWETQGFKTPEYGCDLNEYTGLYRTSFKFSKAWEHKNVILRFDGVHFGYECYVNGNKVGGFGSPYNLCQFNITPYLNTKGDNVLCVKVSTRSFGWQFDTNDSWSLTGITRNVELFALDNVYLEDVTCSSDITADKNAIVKVDVDVNKFINDKKRYKLNISISDTKNFHVLDFTKTITGDIKEYNFEGQIEKPKLWTAETPNLYRLEVCIVDGNGQVVQRVNEKIGLRNVKVDGFDMKVNGRPILLRGVCMSEIDAKNGRALTYNDYRRQLQMMKDANINFVRTAHYPLNVDFLNLCDEMGFYVCVEVPFGSRGAAHLKDDAYIPELIGRADATIRRDKNHPSVIIWSVGNENPYTSVVEEVLKYVKKKDPTRPRGLPQKVGDFMRFTEKPSDNVDVIMGHYLNDTRIGMAVEKSHKPIIFTEYSHSLGLALGDLENKFSRILKEKKIIGGSVWCWSDQAIMTLGDNQKNAVFKSVKVDSLRYLDCYGRNVVDEGKKEVWKEAADGIIYGDGYPQEDYFMVRKVYSPVVVKTNHLKAQSGTNNSFNLDIDNRFDFISLNGYSINWSLRNINKVVDSGSLWLKAKSREQETITINGDVPEDLKCNDLMLCLEIVDPFSKIISEKNITVDVVGKERVYSSLMMDSISISGKVKKNMSKSMTSIKTDKGTVSISDNGILSITDAGGKNICRTPLYLRVGRPLTITLDYLSNKNKFYWNPYLLMPEIENFVTSKQKEGVRTVINCKWLRKEKKDQFVSGVITVNALSNGVVKIDYELTPSENASGNFLECGLTLKLDDSFDTFRWLGYGPFNSTPGKTAYNERACWTLNKNDIRFIGNKGMVDIAVVTDNQRGLGLWSSSGNFGIENIDGSIYVSQNAIVTGYGSKFTAPEGKVSMDKLGKINGSLNLFVDQPSKPVSFLNYMFKVDGSYPTVVPEQPYKEDYGW